MGKFGNIKLENVNLEDVKNLVELSKLTDAVKAADVSKLTRLLNREKEEEEIVEEKKTKVWVILLAIIGVILIGCIVGYFLYRRFKPDYLEDFEDEFEDDDPFEDDDDFFFTDPEES